MKSIAKTGLAVIALACVVLTSAFAQKSPTIENIFPSLATWRIEIQEIANTSASEDISDEQLLGLRNSLEAVTVKLLIFLSEQQPKLDQFSEKISKFGPPPVSGAEPESEIVSQERKALAEKKGQVEGGIKQANLLIVEITQQIRNVAERRRLNFARALLKRQYGAFSPSLWSDIAATSGTQLQTLSDRLVNWVRFTVQGRTGNLLMALLGAGLIGIATFAASRRLLGSSFVRHSGRPTPSQLRCGLTAVLTTVVPTIAIGVGAYAVYVLLDQFGVLDFRVKRLASALLTAFVGMAAVYNLSQAVLAPRHKEWRVFSVSDAAARRLCTLSLTGGVVYALDFIMSEIAIMISAPLTLTMAKSVVSTVLIVLTLSAILLTPLRKSESGKALQNRGWPSLLRNFLWLAIIAQVIAITLGYVSLGRFISTQLVVTGGTIVFMYLGFLIARALSSAETVKDSFYGRWLKSRFDLEDGAVEQLGLVSGLIIDFANLFVGIPLILLQWGFRWEDVSTWITKVLTGFKVGEVEISVSTLFTGLVVFGLGLLVTRHAKNWLNVRIIDRSRLDPGVKNSITTGVGYFGIIVSASLAIAYAGIDLSNLALIAGALSVGIGFGLQNIVNNFVSGLILLVERPVKVGDWIGVGGYDGFVKRISVRATELETLDRQSVVVPNAELINSSVTNWMLKDKVGRISVCVGVSYSSDEMQVREVLLDVAKAHPDVVASPGPDVIFQDFGESSLDFELRVFLRDVGRMVPVSSDLRFAIRKALREADIEIPFPQRDLHVRTADGLIGMNKGGS